MRNHSGTQLSPLSSCVAFLLFLAQGLLGATLSNPTVCILSDSIQQDLMQGSAALALRTPSGAAGCPPGAVGDWDVSDVIQFMHFLKLGHEAGKFEKNAVDGECLLECSEEEFIQELGLTKIQTGKIIRAIKKIVSPAP